MATITITRGFNQNSGLNSVSIVGVHTPLSLYFDFDRGVATNTYSKIIVNGYEFSATKISTVGNVDSYVVGGDFLKYLLIFPNLTPSSLFLSPTIVINGYNSSGSIIATQTHPSFKICHAISNNKEFALEQLATNGRTKKIYYTEQTYYYYSPTATEFFVNNNSTYTGNVSINGATLNVYYIPYFENGVVVYWLNKDGCFDNCIFTLLTRQNSSTKSGESSLYAANLEDFVADTLNYKNEATEKITLKAIAVDTEHFEQLTYLASTLCIYINGELWEFDSGSDVYSPCKQNLNFTLTLKRKYYAQSY